MDFPRSSFLYHDLILEENVVSNQLGKSRPAPMLGSWPDLWKSSNSYTADKYCPQRWWLAKGTFPRILLGSSRSRRGPIDAKKALKRLTNTATTSDVEKNCATRRKFSTGPIYESGTLDVPRTYQVTYFTAFSSAARKRASPRRFNLFPAYSPGDIQNSYRRWRN